MKIGALSNFLQQLNKVRAVRYMAKTTDNRSMFIRTVTVLTVTGMDINSIVGTHHD